MYLLCGLYVHRDISYRERGWERGSKRREREREGEREREALTVVPVFDCLSLPAKSTRLSLPTLM